MDHVQKHLKLKKAGTSMTDVSIIIPSHNCEKYISNTLDSIIHQTLKNIEIIIVNDGSIDKTLNIVKEFSKKDSRIRIINQNESGPTKSRWKGLEAASSEYILFCDSDDLLNRYAVEKMYAAIRENNSDVAICDYCEFVNDESVDLNKNTNCSSVEVLNNDDLMKEISLCSKIQNFFWGKLFKKKILLSHTPDLECKIWEDVGEMCKFFSFCTSGIFINEDLWFYRKTSSSLSKNWSLDSLNTLLEKMSKKFEFINEHYPNVVSLMEDSIYQTLALCIASKTYRNNLLYKKVLKIYKKITKTFEHKIKYLLLKFPFIFKFIKRM